MSKENGKNKSAIIIAVIAIIILIIFLIIFFIKPSNSENEGNILDSNEQNSLSVYNDNNSENEPIPQEEIDKNPTNVEHPTDGEEN